MNSRLPLALVLIACASASFGASQPEFPQRTAAPWPSVLAYAAANRIATDRIDALSPEKPGATGDSVTAFVSLVDAKGERQWVTEFTIAGPDQGEQARPRPRTASVDVKFNGRSFKFEDSAPLALSIRTAGPFAPAQKAAVDLKTARALVSPTFLALGLDTASEVLIVGKEMHDKAVAAGVPRNVPPNLSDDQARAMAGILPALFSFFEGIEKTPGLADILWSVLEKPSLWSVAKNRGVSLNFDVKSATPVEPAAWGVPGQRCYRLEVKLMLNGKAALNCWWFVTSPRPPLLTTAGIVGMIAISPEDSSKRLEIRVLAAHRHEQRLDPGT